MKRIAGMLLGLWFLFSGVSIVAAQEDSAQTTPPPKVMLILREFLKPGKGGMTHEKSESAFVQAFTRAKWPTHYFAADSLSGKARCLFIVGYDSFDAWEKDNLAMQKNPALTAALDHAQLVDGELLSDYDATLMNYREDQSLRAPVDIAHMRYLEISLFHVRPGHRKDWDDLVKLVIPAYDKIPSAHWATYEVAYGQQEDDTYVIISPLKSASEIDTEFAQDKDFAAAMGDEGMKKLGELEAAAIESSQSNLFQFDPKMSYVSEEWKKADPEFWAPKAAKPAMAPKKPAEKPAGAQ
jgi:hypothetical protein